MKAIVCDKYGSPDLLQLKEVEKPIPKEDEALVRIHASSVNAADLETLRGDFVVRITGPFRPRHKILGSDVAGKIEAVGYNVKGFTAGDEIWGDLSFPHSFGAFAEYVCIPETALRRKPSDMTFEEAASIPTAAVVALQNLRDKRQIQPGQKVLINGAGGSVGTFAIQFAKHFGAEVTGVDSTEKLDLLRFIGADHVIDYTQEDFTKAEFQYDLILDVVVGRSFSEYRCVLSPDGIVVMVGGSLSRVFLNLLQGRSKSKTGDQEIAIVPWRPNDQVDLDFIQKLFEAEKVKPVIDRTYKLIDVPEALRYLAEGRSQGKVVITMVDE